MTTTTAQIARRANHPTLKTGDPVIVSKGATWSQGMQPVDAAKEGPVVGKAGSVSSRPGDPVFVDSDGDILVHFDSTGPSSYCSVEYVTPDTGDVSTDDYAIDTAVCTTDGGKVWRISLTADRTQVRIKDQLSSVDPMLITFDASMPAILEPIFRFTDKDSTADILARVEAIKHAVGFMAARDRGTAALRTASQQHHDDIAAISEALNEEATGRDWCEEYDTFVEGLNDGLHVPMTRREKEWNVSGRVRVEVWIDAETTITQVGEPDRDTVEDHLRDMIDGDMVRDAADNDYDVNDVYDVNIREA